MAAVLQMQMFLPDQENEMSFLSQHWAAGEVTLEFFCGLTSACLQSQGP